MAAARPRCGTTRSDDGDDEYVAAPCRSSGRGSRPVEGAVVAAHSPPPRRPARGARRRRRRGHVRRRQLVVHPAREDPRRVSRGLRRRADPHPSCGRSPTSSTGRTRVSGISGRATRPSSTARSPTCPHGCCARTPRRGCRTESSRACGARTPRWSRAATGTAATASAIPMSSSAGSSPPRRRCPASVPLPWTVTSRRSGSASPRRWPPRVSRPPGCWTCCWRPPRSPPTPGRTAAESSGRGSAGSTAGSSARSSTAGRASTTRPPGYLAPRPGIGSGLWIARQLTWQVEWFRRPDGFTVRLRL